MVNLNRNNSNWSFEERRKINENWAILEGVANSTASGNNGVKQELDELKITVSNNTARSTNAIQVSQQTKVRVDQLDLTVSDNVIKINNALEIAEEANVKSEYVQEQLDSIVANGDSSAEVVQARRGNSTLRDRLDKDLLDNQEKINEKVDRAYVDGLLSDLTRIQPVNTYASLALLEQAFPQGSPGIYLVTDPNFTDGFHGFIFSETERVWKDTGVWQATGYAENSVKPINTTFLNISENVFDFENLIIGKTLNTDTGQLIDNAGICVTDFIDVKPNEFYTPSKPCGAVIYNKNNQRVQSYGISANSFSTINSGAKMRLFTTYTNAFELSVIKGQTPGMSEFGFSLKGDTQIKREVSAAISETFIKKKNDEYTTFDFLRVSKNASFNNMLGKFENEYVWRNEKNALNLRTTGLATSSFVQFDYVQPLNIEGISELVLVFYLPDVTAINSIQLVINMQGGGTWQSARAGNELKNGFNIVRLPAARSTFGDWNNFVSARFFVNTNKATNLYLSKITAVQPKKAKILFVDDHGYSNFKNYAYPKLKALGIPVTWALNHGRLGQNGILTKEEIDELALDANSVFNFHTINPAVQATQNLTPQELRDETIQCIRYLNRNGLQSRYQWRSVFVQNLAVSAFAIRDLVDAYSTPVGSATSDLYPFIDQWNIGRVGTHGRDAAWYDSELNRLKKTRSLIQWYTHDVQDNDPIDMTYAEVDLMISKLTEAMAEGWLEGVTFESLRGKYDKIFPYGDLEAYADTL